MMGREEVVLFTTKRMIAEMHEYEVSLLLHKFFRKVSTKCKSGFHIITAIDSNAISLLSHNKF